MENYLTKREEAYSVHQRILTNGKIVQSALIDMCRDLKTMRDDNLYIELGYDTFEDYSEQACGIKSRQAHSYISAYEKLGEEYMEENAGLGITKLELISQISSYEREEFLENNNVDELSTRELKKQVDEFKNRIEQLTFNLDNVQSENKELMQQIKDMQDSMVNTEMPDVIATVEPDPEIISQAVTKAVEQEREHNTEEIEKLKNKLKNEKDKNKLLSDSKEKEIEEAKNKAVADANKRIDELLAKNKESDEKLQQALKSAKAANADEDVTAIRFLFTDLQSTASKIKEHLDKVQSKDSEQSAKLALVMKKTLNTIAENI